MVEEKNSPFAETARDYLLLVIFTGVRKNEGLSLRWSDIDFNDKSFSQKDTKTNTTLNLPMSDFILDLLYRRYRSRESEWVFPGAKEGAPAIFTKGG